MKGMKVTKSNFTGKAGSAFGKMILSGVVALLGVVVLAACLVAALIVDWVVIQGQAEIADFMKVLTETETFSILDIAVFAVFAVIGFLFLLLFLAGSTTIIIRWKVNHTYINTCKLVFDGKAGQLWGHYIAWTFLTIITLSIYGWWNWARLHKWAVKHTYFEELVKATVEPMPAFSYGYAPMN